MSKSNSLSDWFQVSGWPIKLSVIRVDRVVKLLVLVSCEFNLNVISVCADGDRTDLRLGKTRIHMILVLVIESIRFVVGIGTTV